MRVRTRSLLAAGLSAAALSVLPATAGADGFPLVGWWPMNEGSGQVIHDWSGHGNNGTLGNSAGVDDQDPAWIRGRLRGLCAELRRQRHGADPGLHEPRAGQRDGRGLDPRHAARPGSPSTSSARAPTTAPAARTASTPPTAAAWPSTSATDRRTTRALARGARPRSGTASGITPRAPSTARRCGCSSTASGGRARHCRPRARSSLQAARRAAASSATTAAPATCSSSATSTACRSGRSALPVADIWRFLKALFSTSR